MHTYDQKSPRRNPQVNQNKRNSFSSSSSSPFEKYPSMMQAGERFKNRPSINRSGIPTQLKENVEALSGMSFDNVRVHYQSDKPARVNALAYTQGPDIYVSAGQEKHLPHELWHVVQQSQGRVKPTMQMKGMQVNDDSRLEIEADNISSSIFKERNLLKETNQSNATNVLCNSVCQLRRRAKATCEFNGISESHTSEGHPLRVDELNWIAKSIIVNQPANCLNVPWQCAEPKSMNELLKKYSSDALFGISDEFINGIEWKDIRWSWEDEGEALNIEWAKNGDQTMSDKQAKAKVEMTKKNIAEYPEAEPCDTCKSWIENPQRGSAKGIKSQQIQLPSTCKHYKTEQERQVAYPKIPTQTIIHDEATMEGLKELLIKGLQTEGILTTGEIDRDYLETINLQDAPKINEILPNADLCKVITVALKKINKDLDLSFFRMIWWLNEEAGEEIKAYAKRVDS